MTALKPLTSLIVDIDEMARTDFEPSDVAAIAEPRRSPFRSEGGGGRSPRSTSRCCSAAWTLPPVMRRCAKPRRDCAADIGTAGSAAVAAKVTFQSLH